MTLVAILSACDGQSSSSNAPADADSSCSAAVISSSSVQNPPSSSSHADVSSSSVQNPSSSSEPFNGPVSYGTLTDPRDGQTYKTVAIGTQNWMAQNLNFHESRDGAIRADSSWCFNDSASYCQTSGRLYNWATAMNIGDRYNSGFYFAPSYNQGICPDGWHLPSRDDVSTLLSYIDDNNGDEDVSTSLLGDPLGSNRFGFSAAPAGTRWKDGTFMWGSLGLEFWESLEKDSTRATFAPVTTQAASIAGEVQKAMGLSVRCVQDDLHSSSGAAYGKLSDTRDGKVYKTITIGEQTWMAENISFFENPDGTDQVYLIQACESSAIVCAEGRGLTYRWKTAESVCPDGWHLPDSSEWQELANFVKANGSDSVGASLKSRTGWKEYVFNTSAKGTDAFGFNAVPAPPYHNRGQLLVRNRKRRGHEPGGAEKPHLRTIGLLQQIRL